MMTNSTSPPLPLEGIKLPLTEPSIWPLAWGWWAVIIATLATIVLVGLWLYQRQQKRKALKEAKLVLKTLTDLSEINALLKRTALTYFDRETVAKLTGTAWLHFLDAQLPVKHQGFVAIASLWQQGIFSTTPLSEDDVTQCQRLAMTWLEHALPPRQRKNEERSHV